MVKGRHNIKKIFFLKNILKTFFLKNTFLKSSQHYCLDSLLWLVTLNKHAKESSGDGSTDGLPALFGFSDMFTSGGVKPQHWRNNDNPLSHSIPQYVKINNYKRKYKVGKEKRNHLNPNACTCDRRSKVHSPVHKCKYIGDRPC